MIEKPVKK